MREDARLGLIAVIGALVLFAWDRRGEQLARVGDVVGADARTVLRSCGRNGLAASSVMGVLLSGVRLQPLILRHDAPHKHN